VKILKRAIEQGKAKSVLLLHGLMTTRAAGLRAASRIEVATGCTRRIPSFNGRIEKGPDLPLAKSMPYFSEQQKKLLGDIEVILLVNAKTPAGFFGYPSKGENDDRAGWVLPPGCDVVELAAMEDDGIDCLERIAELLGAAQDAFEVVGRKVPNMPALENPLDARLLGDVMANMVPADFILSDEGNERQSFVRDIVHHAHPHVRHPCMALALISILAYATNHLPLLQATPSVAS
jgi:acetolactate synthase-1/2/3 large subunit